MGPITVDTQLIPSWRDETSPSPTALAHPDPPPSPSPPDVGVVLFGDQGDDTAL